MKKIIILFSLICFINCNKQQENSKHKNVETTENTKIKVYLLGTFHFAQEDESYNILGDEKQKSIEHLSNIIAKQKPDKIFAERQPEYEYRMKIDSLYKTYQKRVKPLKAKNEIYQVGFRTARKLGHSRIYLCDHPGMYGTNYNATEKYAKENNQMDILDAKTKGTTVRYDDLVDEDSIMSNSTLYEYMQWINSKEVMITSHASYLNTYTQVGSTDYYNYDDDDTLIGAELTAGWYRRNIMIYTKIINQLSYDEKAIFLLIGADHIPIIQSLFEGNPYFEVVKIDKWLI